VLLVVSSLAVAPAGAQTFRGTILGTVTDASGATVPGAKVRVVNDNTGLARETQTSEDGSYAIPELPIGSYTVTVEKDGFQTSVTTGVRVEVAVERRVDATLQAGDVSQRIEVSGESLAQVETTSNILGGAFEAREILDLPVNGRDYQKLLFLVPGAAGDPSGGMDSPGSFGLVSVNGNRGRSNNYLLDGTDMNDGYRNLPAINQGGVFGTPGTVLPVEAIAEVRVLSNWEAEYGRNAGSVVNIVTNSGTNEFHGSVFEYFRNDALNARNFFNIKRDPVSGTPIPKDDFSNHQFGAAVGGPLKKDRTFWYFTYEGQRERVGVTSQNQVPNVGDFDAAFNTLSGGTSTPCAGTVIDCVTTNSAFVNPVILNLFNLCASDGRCSGGSDVWPAENVTGNPDFNAVTSAPARNNANSFIFKLDHNFTANHQLTGRYFFGDSDQSFPLGLSAGSNLPGNNTDSPIRAQLISVSYISVWTPNVVNEARFGWNLYQQDFFSQDRKVFGDPNVSLGMNNGVTLARAFGLPFIRVDGFAFLGSNVFNPRGRDSTNWHFIDGVSVKRGRHEWKFGYEFRRAAVDSFFDALHRGLLRFDGQVTGDPLADFLLGAPNSTNFGRTRVGRGNTERENSQNSHAVYAQDSWRLTPRFTVNLGLRYDFYGVINDEGNNFSVYDPVAGLVLRPELYNVDGNNFSPRVSLAWDLGGNGSTVLRAGFGMFYDAFPQDIVTGQFPWNCFLCPGVAHNPTGPNPVTLAAFPNVAVLSPGVDIWPAVGGDQGDINTLDKIDTPYVYNFNLNLQQQLGSKTMFQIGYVGSAGHKLFRIRDINTFDTATISALDIACAGGAGLPIGLGCVYAGKPFDNAAILDPVNSPFVPFYVNQLETTANSNFHSLQVSFLQRNWGGLTQQVNYRWSHAIDNASDGQDSIPNQSMPQDGTNPAGERGNSNFDQRHSFVWTATYDFPRWEAAGWFGDGWQISGVVTISSGQPFHINNDFTDDYSGSQEFFDRPDIIAPPQYNRGNPSQFLSLTSFAVPCTLDPAGGGNVFADACLAGSRHFGTLGRNSLRGPNFRNMDFSLVKITSFGERVKLHLRADVFNLFNHPNFANPWLPTFFAAAAAGDGSNISTAPGSLGTLTGFLPLTATVDVGLGNPILGGGGPRSIQFAFKLLW
jgi:outer membrane receptor protein involved in Fe transport